MLAFQALAQIALGIVCYRGLRLVSVWRAFHGQELNIICTAHTCFVAFTFLPIANAEVALKLERHSLGAATMPRDFNRDGKRRIARTLLSIQLLLCRRGLLQLHKGFSWAFACFACHALLLPGLPLRANATRAIQHWDRGKGVEETLSVHSEGELSS